MKAEHGSLWETGPQVLNGNRLESLLSVPTRRIWERGPSLPGISLLDGDRSCLPLVKYIAGATAVFLTGVGMKSLVRMAFWKHRLREERTKNAAPGPTPLPFLGNVVQLRKNYYGTLYGYVDKPASVFWVMSTPFVVINEEDGLRRVLGGAGGLYSKPKYFGYRSKTVKDAVKSERERVSKESVSYQNDGDASRIALDSMVKDSMGVIKTSMKVLLEQLEEASREVDSNQAIEDAVSVVRKAIVSLNLHVLFGLDEDRGSAEDPSRISDMIGFAGTEFAQRMVNPLKTLVDLPGNIRFFRDVGGLISLGRRLCRILDDIAEQCFDEKVVPGTEVNMRSTSGLSWVHAWVGKVGRIGKLGKVVGLLMASTQTVPLSSVWMLHLVGNAPSVRESLLRELHELGVASAVDLTYDHLADMPVADAVIKETLRLYPPFPLIQREAQDDDVLGGISIPRGTPVYVVPWLIHRNPKYWADADQFKPQRFMEHSPSHGDAPSDWVYVPFGRGPRMCAGSKLALAELKVLLCHAVLSYEWESRCDATAKVGQFPELGMVPKGIKFVFRPAKSGSKL